MSLKITAVPDKGRLKVRQSPTPHLPANPSRIVFAANSGGGKTNLIVSLLTNPRLYGGNVYDAVFVVSPSVKLDSTWKHLIDYRAKRGQKEAQFFFDTWNEATVQKIMDESARITAFHKEKGHTRGTPTPSTSSTPRATPCSIHSSSAAGTTT